MKYTQTYSSNLAASPEEVWQWVTSVSGISKEMAPYLKMSFPSEVADLTSAFTEPGTKMFRSWLKLFGVVPFDYSDLTLESLEPGVGFIEQSPMGSMRSWRHERYIEPLPDNTSTLTDRLTFEPRMFGKISSSIVRAFFTHRHRMLVKHLGNAD